MTAPRALVVRGGWEGHTPEATVARFLPFLEREGFRVTVEDSLEVYADAQVMAATDLVVQCWTMGEILVDEMRGLREAVAAGTGFAGWHGGVLDAFRMATDFHLLVGGQFTAHPGDLVDHRVDIVRTDHPVTAGLESFDLHSEQYWVQSDPLIDVLATTTIVPGPGDPWQEPMVSPAVWTRRWGRGRVFVCAPGHSVADLDVPQVRTIIERGMVWAARRPDEAPPG